MDISNFTKATGLYLKAEEVIKNPTAIFVITTEAELVDKEYKGQKSQKLQVEGEFNQQPRILELSKTNARLVEQALGSDTAKWVGHKLVLETYKTKTTEGKLTDAINIKSVN